MSHETWIRNWLRDNANVKPSDVLCSHICTRGCYVVAFYAFRNDKIASALVERGTTKNPMNGGLFILFVQMFNLFASIFSIRFIA